MKLRNVKWKSLYDDLLKVLRRYLQPDPKDSTLVGLIEQIHALGEIQKGINESRKALIPLAAQIKSSELCQELDRLAAMAPKEEPEAFDRKNFDGYDDDFMFI